MLTVGLYILILLWSELRISMLYWPCVRLRSVLSVGLFSQHSHKIASLLFYIRESSTCVIH